MKIYMTLLLCSYLTRIINDFLQIKPNERKETMTQLDEYLKDRVENYWNARGRLLLYHSLHMRACTITLRIAPSSL